MAAAAAAAAAAKATASQTLDSEEDKLLESLACVRWLGRFVGSEQDFAQAGLFRVPPADSTMGLLRQAMEGGGEGANVEEVETGEEDGSSYGSRIRKFVAQNESKRGIAECANAVASLLKQNLRNFCKPLLPFKFCTEDLRAFDLDQTHSEEERAEVGAFMAQDVVHVIVTFHAECKDETLQKIVVLVAQTMALLCSVSRAPAFKMSSYDLFVPFLPSICGARDPVEFMSEHNTIKELNDQRRKAELEGRRPPQTRLELLIVFGHRIWGYISATLSSLDVAIEALREYDQEHGKNMQQGQHVHHMRKRDVLKNALKVHRWFRQKSTKNTANNKQDPSTSSSHLAKASESKLSSGNMSSALNVAKEEPGYTYGSPMVFHEKPGLRQMATQRVQSVRLTPRRSSDLHPDSRREAASLGKKLYRQATSSEADVL